MGLVESEKLSMMRRSDLSSYFSNDGSERASLEEGNRTGSNF